MVTQAEKTVKSPAQQESLDNILDRLLDDNEKVSFRNLEQQLLKIESLIHHNQKRASEQRSEARTKDRKACILFVTQSKRGWKVTGLALLSSGCHMASAFSTFAPKISHGGANTFNRFSNWATMGRFKLFDGLNLDPAQAADLEKITHKFSTIFGGGAQAVDQVTGGVFNPRKQAFQYEKQTDAEDLKSKKEEELQKTRDETNKIEASRHKAQQRGQAHHDIIMAILRG